MTDASTPTPTPAPIDPTRRDKRPRRTFAEDFARFFVRGLGTLLPTIITIGVIWWVFDFLWNSLGKWIIYAIGRAWVLAIQQGWFDLDPVSTGYIGRELNDKWWTQPLGVLLALLLIYLVGLLVGNFLGRALYRAAEALVMRVPVVRAVYPAVKQVTDFLLADKDQQFEGSRVVAVQAHDNGIWSVALVTGPGLPALNQATRKEMVTVFVPSSPTAVSGYVMLAPREEVVELPLSVEEAMRLLVSGGVILPKSMRPQAQAKPDAAKREMAEGPAPNRPDAPAASVALQSPPVPAALSRSPAE